MIKFFRKIRQKLIEENKVRNYLKYALGEIVLVVVGILIALSINNWNQNRINRLQGIESLVNLKFELLKNIEAFKTLDSLYTSFEESTAKGIEMLNSDLSVKDLIQLDTLIASLYTTFPLTRSTYEEMLNTGNFYNIKNEKLKSEISDLYLQGERWTTSFVMINRNTQEAYQNPALFSYYHTLDRLNSPAADLKGIDTLWVGDMNSPTFLALYYKAKIYQSQSNSARRMLAARQIDNSRKLILSIDNYLNEKTQ